MSKILSIFWTFVFKQNLKYNKWKKKCTEQWHWYRWHTWTILECVYNFRTFQFQITVDEIKWRKKTIYNESQIKKDNLRKVNLLITVANNKNCIDHHVLRSKKDKSTHPNSWFKPQNIYTLWKKKKKNIDILS